MCVHYVAGFCRLLKLKVLLCKLFFVWIRPRFGQKKKVGSEEAAKVRIVLKKFKHTHTHSLSD